MSPRSGRILMAIVLAGLWTAGSLWRATSHDLQTVVLTCIVGAIAGLLMYWLLDRFSGRLRR
jgi:ABC-type Fe3+-siderophore transport system permease subunit